MHKSISIAIAAAVIALPVGAVVEASGILQTRTTQQAAATHAPAQQQAATSTHPTPTPTTKHATPTRSATPVRSTTRTIQGPSVDMDWGPVQVTIIVKGNAVTDLSATAPNERARSAYINNIAVPMLRKEVLQAKTVANIKNIYAISGATLTSDAFYQSLLAALQTAHLT